ncbi:MAG TPA: hypothetical protein VH280_10765 [Verrucomicrobiae bacterium]|jgi:hypothetical protein|nr:hypothetical protein [Verrucomicrobiae bacterium]
MPSPAFISILRSDRDEFNARFAAARHLHPDLEPDVFGEFLTTTVDELAQAVEKARADRLGDVMIAAYDAGLQLVGQRLAGPGSRFPCIEEAWRRVLSNAAPVVATAPGQLIPSVCNAVHQLASTAGARPEQWIDAMEKLGRECEDAATFLRLGQLCAWRAGLAHFRNGALAAADALPESLVLTILGAKIRTPWPAMREQFLASPWFNPGNETKPSSAVRAVAQVGTFKGYGGLFIEPPTVTASGEQLFARSDSEYWLLTADIFGATFHRSSVKEFETANQTPKLPHGLEVKGSRIAVAGERLDFPELGEIASAAANTHTLAITSRLTHAITLIALK